jgi:hypothetical protein
MPNHISFKIILAVLIYYFIKQCLYYLYIANFISLRIIDRSLHMTEECITSAILSKTPGNAEVNTASFVFSHNLFEVL